MSGLRLSTFRVDVTPPLGHPLCAGWVKPAAGVSDPLFAIGVVLTGEGAPIVLCAVDWCEISNDEHAIWRETLAEAAETSADRVAVHCGHQHDAPWPDRGAQRLADLAPNPPRLMDEDWCQAAVERVAEAVRESIPRALPVTEIGIGQARVRGVASNRRIMGRDGKVKAVRFTKCPDPALRAKPAGIVDPMLKTVSFWSGSKKLAALHYFAVHPCSYYGDGWVTGDFVAHARERRVFEDAGAEHIYFTGCAGNIGPGKYNDGSPENRPVLAGRVYRAMVESELKLERLPAERLEWRVRRVALPPDLRLSEAELLKVLFDTAQRSVDRSRAALRIAYLRRWAAGKTIPLTALFLGDGLGIVHLPGEAFVEYQLFAQRQRPDRFVAVAAYGDCGTGYIPLAKSYAEGGYEPTDAFVSPRAEALMYQAIAELLEP